MKTSTAIAIALAIIIVVAFFVIPGLSPFGSPFTKKAPANNANNTNATTTSMATTSDSESTVGALQTNATSTMNMNMTTTADGLQIGDTVVGTGATAEAGDTVTVEYVGQFADGTIFDASARHPETANGFTFQLGATPPQVIAGWDEGIVGMKEGGERMLVIPPSLAYGASGVPGIPGNSTLTFFVKLLKVTPAGS